MKPIISPTWLDALVRDRRVVDRREPIRFIRRALDSAPLVLKRDDGVLSVRDALLLFVLDNSSRASVFLRIISRRTGINTGAVPHIASSLMDKGLVKIEGDREDHYVFLTPKGRALVGLAR